MPAPSKLFFPALAAAAGFLGLGFAQRPEQTPLNVAPIAYFQAQCARCHGTVTSPSNTAFEKPLPNDELKRFVEDMAAGPGGKALAGRDLDALVGLHRAMIAKQPYLAWTGRDGRKLKGDVSPGAKVTAKSGKNAVTVTVKGLAWSLEIPVGTSPGDITLEAVKGKASTKLDLRRHAFTHWGKTASE
jgi:hypothetical protein